MSRAPAALGSELRLSLAVSGSLHWLVLDGDLDGHTRGAVARTLTTLRAQGVNSVVVDLRGLRRFDDEGLGVLLDAIDDGWELRWRRPLDDRVAEAVTQALVTDFFMAVDAALSRAMAASRLARQLELVDDQPAPPTSSVVWIARRDDTELDLTAGSGIPS